MAKINIIKASAGSGKTYTLAYQYIRKIIVNPSEFRKILAVTFTNKATFQMKDKILNNLMNLIRNPSDEPYIEDLKRDTGLTIEQIQKNAVIAEYSILSDYNNFSISTIDKFFNKIVRVFFNELHKDPSYEVALSTDELIAHAIADVISDKQNEEILNTLLYKRLSEGKNSDIQKEFATMSEDIVKVNLQKDFPLLQKRFDDDLHLVEDFQNKIVRMSQEIASYLFTDNKATVDDYAGGSRGGIASNVNKLSEGNFKTASLTLGKYIMKFLDDGVTIASKKASVDTLRYISSIRDKLHSDLSKLNNLVDDYNKHGRIAATVKCLQNNLVLLQFVELVNRKYKDNCQRDHIIPISDMPHIVSDIAHNVDMSFLYQKIDSSLNSIMIDEFQDTSQQQWNGFIPILDEICSRCYDDANLIIGDIKQAIYRWRGGNEELLRKSVKQQFKKYANEQSLQYNFRSSGNIVEFNNSLYDAIKGLPYESLIKFEGQDEIMSSIKNLINETYIDSTQKIGKQDKGNKGYVECYPLEQEEMEEEICKKISRVLELGYSYSDIAVIVRDNIISSKIAALFSDHNIPFISADSLLLSHSVIIRKIISLLHYAIDRTDNIHLAEYNYLTHQNTDHLLDTFTESQNQALDSILSEPLINGIQILIESFSLQNMETELAFFDSFMNIVYTKQTEDAINMAEFVEWWDETGKDKRLSSPEGQNAVTIITIHKSKGLEYPVVIAPYLNWNILPKTKSRIWVQADDDSPYYEYGMLPIDYTKICYHSYFRNHCLKETQLSIIDNINLLYVLTTRAKDRLYLLYPNKNTANTTVNLLSSAISIMAERKNIEFSSPVFYVGKEDEIKTVLEETETIINSENLTNLLPCKNSNLKLSTSAFDFDSDNINTKELREGVFMHNVLSRISSLDQLEEEVKIEVAVQGSEYETYKIYVDNMLSNKQVRLWFDPKWKVFTERGIITPHAKLKKRPDRVITDGKSAIVIDYKFGDQIINKYVEQINQYIYLLTEMGYTDVKGYIYYIKHNRIDPVIV